MSGAAHDRESGRVSSRKPTAHGLDKTTKRNAPAAPSIFMSAAAHDRRARFIGTAKRTGKAEKGLMMGTRIGHR